jgi:hypothetical protein
MLARAMRLPSMPSRSESVLASGSTEPFGPGNSEVGGIRVLWFTLDSVLYTQQTPLPGPSRGHYVTSQWNDNREHLWAQAS